VSEDRPDALALIVEAQRTLSEEIIPQSEQRERYKMLMIANALGIALRELKQANAVHNHRRKGLEVLGFSDDAAVVAKLRSDNTALTPDLYSVLMEETTARVAISNPKAI
jgi:hypothetical protein